MAHFARALQRCGKIAGVATTTVAATAYCDAAINKKDFTPLVVARNDKIGANVHKVTLAFPAVHQSNCRDAPRRDAGSMACPWGSLTARFGQHARIFAVEGTPDALVDLRTGAGARPRRKQGRRRPPRRTTRSSRSSRTQ